MKTKRFSHFRYQPSAEILDYASTKAAIVGFTKGLAPKLLDKGIRVNSIAPGPVWTPLIVSSLSKEKFTEFGAMVRHNLTKSFDEFSFFVLI